MSLRPVPCALLFAALCACAAPAPRAPAEARAPHRAASERAAAAVAPRSRDDDVATAFAALNRIRHEAEAQGSLLGAWSVYLNARDGAVDPLRDFLNQTLAAMEAELGRYDDALHDYPSGKPITLGQTAAFPDPTEFDAVPAADAIARLARDRRLVLVNEVHHDAHTRLLTLELLPRLRAAGFTHFAAETLDERDTDFAARGYPVDASGYYSREPLYGEILRRAAQLGFVVVPYESTVENADRDRRERDQAEHLYQRVFAHAPDARLFVHAGYAHVHKARGHLWDTTPLAQQLAARLHTVPLSVDQTLLRPSREEGEYGAYPLLLQNYAPLGAVVLRRKTDGALWTLEPDFYDVSVLLPRSATPGRPDWLTLDGARRATPIDDALCGETRPCLIEARYAGERGDAVPADRWLRLPGEAMAPLYLFPGRYRLRASGAHGTLLAERDLVVPIQPSAETP